MADHLKIIQDYGALIERNPPRPTRIEDTSVLPHPKAAILEALMFEIEQGHPRHVDNMLRSGAISLAQYQWDVGDRPDQAPPALSAPNSHAKAVIFLRLPYASSPTRRRCSRFGSSAM